jgi:hypothetical protein
MHHGAKSRVQLKKDQQSSQRCGISRWFKSMANDAPTSLWMGFGFPQARASGAPYVRPRSVSKVNWDLKNKKCERKLGSLAKQHPTVETFIREIVELRKVKGLPACSAVELYHIVLFHHPKLSPPSYWEYALNEYGFLPPGHPLLRTRP